MNDKLNEYTSIKYWNEEDQPREKLAKKGRSACSDSELIAILIGTGTRRESAISISQKLLKSVEYDLNRLNNLSIAEMMKIKGIGEAKAIKIIAALELSVRRMRVAKKEKYIINSPDKAYTYIRSYLENLNQEQFWTAYLAQDGHVKEIRRIATGGVTGVLVDMKLVFKNALDLFSPRIVVAHNHPSGAIKPSQADISLTKKLIQAGKVLSVDLLDHLIIGQDVYYSFQNEMSELWH